MNRFLHVIFCAIWLSLLSNHLIAQSEESDLDCLEFELLEKDENGFHIYEGLLVGQFLEGSIHAIDHWRGADFYYVEVDLNDDNQPEVFFASNHFNFCGSATCSIQLYQKHEDGTLRDVLGDSINVVPSIFSSYDNDNSFGQRICVLDSKVDGWKNFAVSQGRSLFVINNGYYEGQRK